jgi:hypothetical protein
MASLCLPAPPHVTNKQKSIQPFTMQFDDYNGSCTENMIKAVLTYKECSRNAAKGRQKVKERSKNVLEPHTQPGRRLY